MPRRRMLLTGLGLSALILGTIAAFGAQVPQAAPQNGSGPTRCGSGVIASGLPCLELRTYEIDLNLDNAGSPLALARREVEILRRSGATVVGSWERVGQPGALVYILSFRDGAFREAVLAALNSDPEWNRLQKDYVIPRPASVVLMSGMVPPFLRDPVDIGRGSGPGPGLGVLPERGPAPAGRLSEPRPLSMPQPEYTQEARDARISGDVEMLILVKEDGTVEFKEFRKTLGYGLDQRAIDAVRKWKFEPGKQDSKPVPVLLTVTVTFSLH